MSNQITIDEAFFDRYENIEIKYPFCYKTKNGKNFFRYLEDGRYEFICLEDKKSTLSFGSRANSIGTLLNENGFYFKILANLNEVITNEDFEFQISLFTKEYEKYLSANKYLSAEVQSKIEKEKKSKNVELDKNNEKIGIITGDTSEESPF
ncbi:MAG TPA: hypothetical protein PKD00_08510 [Burkholderiales bacterium]|nr:hypothetical protein [Burkholderiales bacterium]